MDVTGTRPLALLAPVLPLALCLAALTGCDESRPAGDTDAGSTGDGGGARADGGGSTRGTGSTDSDSSMDGPVDAGAEGDANTSSTGGDDAGGTTGDAATNTGDGGSGDSGDADSHDGGDAGDATCRYDTECGPSEWCRAGECVTSRYCLRDDDCTGGDVCDTVRQLCTRCVEDDDCGEEQHCVDREACTDYEGCVNSLDCSGTRVCDTELGECFRCLGDFDCEEDDVCVDHACKPACESDLDCKSKGLLCRRDQPEQPDHCAECTSHADCSPEQYCDRGTCVADVCAPGEQRCDGGWRCGSAGEVENCDGSANLPACFSCLFYGGWTTTSGVATCNAVGNAFERVTDCGWGAAAASDSCIQGGGSATCEPRTCQPSTSQCESESSMLECAHDGLSETPVSCEANEVCGTDACRPVICTVGDERCEQGHPSVCTGAGTEWEQVETCSHGEYCAPETVRCLPVSGNDFIGTLNSSVPLEPGDYEEHSAAISYGNLLEVTDDRTLQHVQVSYFGLLAPDEGSGPAGGTDGEAENYAVTFFVHRDEGDGTFSRQFELASNLSEACTALECAATLDVPLQANHRYLVGVHFVPTEGAVGVVGTGPLGNQRHFGTVAGRLAQLEPAAPGATYAQPTIDETRSISMLLMTARP